MATTISLQAPDISCGHCVSAVQNRVGQLDGVESVEASAETKVINIAFDADKISLDTIQAELKDEGYPAEAV